MNASDMRSSIERISVKTHQCLSALAYCTTPSMANPFRRAFEVSLCQLDDAIRYIKFLGVSHIKTCIQLKAIHNFYDLKQFVSIHPENIFSSNLFFSILIFDSVFFINYTLRRFFWANLYIICFVKLFR